MPYCEDTIVINGSKKDIYDVFVDSKSFPQWAENVLSVNIIEQKDNSYIAEWKTDVDGRKISWIEEDFPKPEKNRVEYKLVKGDLKKFEGFWQVEDDKSGSSKVTLVVDFEFGIPMLAALLHPILAKKVHSNSKQLLEALKKKVES